MYLYHGTSTRHIDRIVTEGIQPRSVTGRASNWETDVPTHRDYVWLTAAYAIYYAVYAAGDDHDPVIVQVDWEDLTLYPDEDFIASMKTDNAADWREQRKSINPKDYKSMWAASLKHSGNVACKGVPASAIIDHRVIPIEGNSQMLILAGFDTVPTEANYPYMGDHYRQCLEAFFEHPLENMTDVLVTLNNKRFPFV